ncbi:acyltransferase [Brevibacillus sp. NRS-1366]|uniref:acyltransferase n=1 Tax=Brevibacillus sp. NRS-1366 TaxID=3233899 RepID=UPI003D240A0C
MARKERIAELDLVRSFAFLAVVYQHVIGVYMRKPGVDEQTAIVYGMLFHLLKFAVPAFIFITGLVLFYNYYEKVNYATFIRKRVTEILIPYTLWSAVYLSLSSKSLGSDGQMIWHILKKLLTGSSSYHLWFVVMIFQFYLLYPFWQWIFRSIQRLVTNHFRLAMAIGVFGFLYGLLMWFSARYLPAHGFRFDIPLLDTYFIKYRDRNAFYYFYYFLFGGLAAVALPAFRASIKRHWLWIVALFLVMYAYIWYELFRDSGKGVINLNVATSLKPSMVLYTVASLLGVYGVALWIGKRKTKWIHWFTLFGKYSYGSFLIHALVLTYLMKSLRFLGLFNTGLLGSFVAFILCSLISFGISYGLGKVPFGSLLVGATEKKRVPARQAEKAMQNVG